MTGPFLRRGALMTAPAVEPTRRGLMTGPAVKPTTKEGS